MMSLPRPKVIFVIADIQREVLIGLLIIKYLANKNTIFPQRSLSK